MVKVNKGNLFKDEREREQHNFRNQEVKKAVFDGLIK